MTIEELRKKKAEMGYTNEQLSEQSGVPLGTVQKVLSGITKNPRYETLRALEDALSHPSGHPYAYGNMNPADLVQEAAAEYEAKKKLYTVEDYMALPDEQRVELIDGIFYDMAAPRSEHQFMVGEIYAEFLSYVRGKKGSCIPFLSPLDVQLDADNLTMVQPDVIILCDRNKMGDGRIIGAPDLVVEVLSPSTSRKDRTLKLYKYANAGVREYWLIDLKRKKIIVYWLDEEVKAGREDIHIYTFRDKIPVGIWNDECVIDFAQIDDLYTELYGNEE